MGRPSRYPEEFRREAVQLALASEESRAAVARRLGVNETTLRNWVAAHLAEEARAGGSVGGDGVGVRGAAPVASGERGAAHRAGDPAQGSRLFRPGDDPVCRFRFVAEHRDAYGVKRLCRVLGVSRSGFYAWASRPPSTRTIERRRVDRGHRRDPPAGRVAPTAPLGCMRSCARLGQRCGRKRVARLMRSRRPGRGACPRDGGARPLGRRAGTRPGQSRFNPPGPDRALGRGCHPVPHRRRLVASRRGHRLVVAAGGRLVDGATRQQPSSSPTRWSWRSSVADPTAGSCTTPTAAPSTRRWRSRNASPNSSSTSRSVPPATATTTPRSSRSSPPSNANSPGSTHTKTWPTRAELRSALFDYIEGFYNPNRIQRRLGHRSPIDYEQHSAA